MLGLKNQSTQGEKLDTVTSFADFTSLLRASNATWDEPEFTSKFPGMMQRIASALVFAIGDDSLDYLDSSIDCDERILEVLAFGSGTLFHLYCDDTDGPSVDVTRLSAVSELTVTGSPLVHDDALGGGEQPFVFSAQFGARRFEFPLEAGNTIQRDRMPVAYALLRRTLAS